MNTTAKQTTLDNLKAVYLTAEDLRVAASILYNAYHDDPFFIAALHKGDKAQYEQKLRGAIREELHTLWQEEQALIGLFDDQRLIGLACIVTQQVPLGEARYWHWRLKMLMSTGWHSTQALMKKEASILEHLPSTQCGILQFIALTPIEQHKGLGSRLVQAVMSWCDEQPKLDGIGVYVTQESHVHLFSKLGFAAIEKLTIGSVEGDLLFYRSCESE
ncbi:GNAT family N-acetyltransferase [Shewanella mesophila]|uniref:GNAT family N-acetyltransferase n=1 Tax=Shewanella mesophila TaxID=2864208 RepID=UPI001C65905A|nr:GNAT family N-acetyltransferase [Shewanella mesophila]QYJ87277.1 GNAT family N-acetyltransferase [Shewanella mesophila]